VRDCFVGFRRDLEQEQRHGLRVLDLPKTMEGWPYIADVSIFPILAGAAGGLFRLEMQEHSLVFRATEGLGKSSKKPQSLQIQYSNIK